MSNNPYHNQSQATSTGNDSAPSPAAGVGTELPPPYAGSASAEQPNQSGGDAAHEAPSDNKSGFVSVREDNPLDDLGVPMRDRVGMEEEGRELPKGFVRVLDPSTDHLFYVDTVAKTSSWVHPYDDSNYLAKLPTSHPAVEWRRRQQSLQQQGVGGETSSGGNGAVAPVEEKVDGESNGPEKKKNGFGRKLKDKWTKSTHDERESKRAADRDAARKEHEQYLARREQMLRDAQASQYSAPPGYPEANDDVPPPAYKRGYGYGLGGSRGFGGYRNVRMGGMAIASPLLLAGAAIGTALGGY